MKLFSIVLVFFGFVIGVTNLILFFVNGNPLSLIVAILDAIGITLVILALSMGESE